VKLRVKTSDLLSTDCTRRSFRGWRLFREVKAVYLSSITLGHTDKTALHRKHEENFTCSLTLEQGLVYDGRPSLPSFVDITESLAMKTAYLGYTGEL